MLALADRLQLGRVLGNICSGSWQSSVGKVCGLVFCMVAVCLLIHPFFCSKWYEVMPGTWHEVMPELETLIKEGDVQGEWPAARDNWGICANKLETVLLVAIPSEQARTATAQTFGLPALLLTRPPAPSTRLPACAHAHMLPCPPA